MDMRRLVGRNLKRIRLEKGLTQEQFAERSGFTQQYLSGLERGRRNPTIVTLYELSQALDVEHVVLIAPDDEALAEGAGRRPAEGKRSSARRKGGKLEDGKRTKNSPSRK